MDRTSLEQFLSRGLSLAEIGKRLGRSEATVGYWVDKHGLEAVNREKHAARGGLGREELERLVGDGASIAQIASEFDVSRTTVRYWLRRFGLKTLNARGCPPSPGALAARHAGLATAVMTCRHHGESEFALDSRGYYRCKRCRSAAVSRRRRRVKAILVGEAGGRCCICGYDRNMRALHFHHLDPLEKRIEINAKGISLSLEKLRAEARKCILLCSNCHAEVEEGMVLIPDGPSSRYAPT